MTKVELWSRVQEYLMKCELCETFHLVTLGRALPDAILTPIVRHPELFTLPKPWRRKVIQDPRVV